MTLAILLGLFLTIFVLVGVVFSCKKPEFLEKKTQLIGSYFKDNNLKYFFKRQNSNMFFFRRILFSLGLVALHGFGLAQSFLTVFLCLIIVVYTIVVRPFNKMYRNIFISFFEVITLMVAICFMSFIPFRDYHNPEEAKFPNIMAFVCIALILSNTIIATF
jgi:hypothetical protein